MVHSIPLYQKSNISKNRQTPPIIFIFKHIADAFGYRHSHPENFIKLTTLINYLLVNYKTFHPGSTVYGLLNIDAKKDLFHMI